MKKKPNLIIYKAGSNNIQEKINSYYLLLLKERLLSSGLSIKNKLDVLDKLTEILKKGNEA